MNVSNVRSQPLFDEYELEREKNPTDSQGDTLQN